MASFQVTTPTARLRALKPGDTIEVPYTVANVSGGARRGAFDVIAKDGANAGWYSIKGGVTAADFAAGTSQQVTVVVSPPATAAPAVECAFHLFVGLEGQKDIDFADGPVVTYDVVGKTKPAFPWWIVIAVAVLLAIIGGIVAVVEHKPGPTPTPTVTATPVPPGITMPNNLIGLTPGAAKSLMNGLGVSDDRIRTQCPSTFWAPGPASIVVDTIPGAGQALPGTVNLILKVNACQRVRYNGDSVLQNVIKEKIIRAVATPTP